MTTILIVEDEESLADPLAFLLRKEGFEPIIALDGPSALEKFAENDIDIVLLDLMLPEMDGLTVCRRLRANAVTRESIIVMLTAKSEESDQVVGFSLGADDYVTKPFSVRVLLERLKALLRRREGNATDHDVSSNQGVMVDRRAHRVTAGDTLLDLTPSEFGLLDVLIRQPGRAFSRAELIDAALGSDTIVLERTIDVHIRALRQKLGPFADVVETVRGVGYRFRDPRHD